MIRELHVAKDDQPPSDEAPQSRALKEHTEWPVVHDQAQREHDERGRRSMCESLAS
jgi:hypothetical protein